MILRFIKAFVFVLFIPALASAGLPEMPDSWGDGYVYANGIRIHYYHSKLHQKPVIVMAHGVTDIGLCWTTLTLKLQNEYDIYMVDARGHGLSDPFTASDDSDTLIKDLAEFCAKMGFRKPILMGHSMGAATVMRIGAEYPDLARAIIMLDPRLNARTPLPTATRVEAPKTEGSAAGDPAAPIAKDRLPVKLFGTPDELVAQNNFNFDDLVATCHRQSPKWDIVDCQYWALSKKQYHGSYAKETARPLTGVREIGDSLAEISVPALILKADAPADVRKANEEAARVMQHGKLVHIDDSGHNLHHDQLERTVEVLRGFLSSLSAND